MRDVKNILRNAARLGAGKELVRKAFGKYLEPTNEVTEVRAWCEQHATEIRDWLRPEDLPLWDESLSFAEQMKQDAEKALIALEVQLGGGGHYGLLYFLTRSRKPKVVVETGVAAGFSSKAILSAMAENASGELYSSDFPYCRLEEPEKYIGILVDSDLKDRWNLHIKGDRANLPTIASRLQPGSVDILHYDSDKSYSGREFALETLQPYLSTGAICIFDDIQNNWHFRDIVAQRPRDWRVFEFGSKYLGVIGQVRQGSA